MRRAAELGVHPDTVDRAVGRERLGRPSALRPVRPSILDPYKPFLADTLAQHPRLRATRLHAMLHGRGYAGGVLTVRRYVRTIRPRPRAEAYLRLRTLPGEQGQVDWGHFGHLQVGHARRPLVCFVFVLSWSRALYARFALDYGMESFLRGHVAAFTALGGVPRALLYDYVACHIVEVLWPRALCGRDADPAVLAWGSPCAGPHIDHSDASQESSVSSLRQTGVRGNAAVASVGGSQVRRAASFARTLIPIHLSTYTLRI